MTSSPSESRPRSVLRVATRTSPLAMWQARRVSDLLRRALPGVEIELVRCSSRGDQDQTPFAKLFADKSAPTAGLFTKTLDAALLDGRADVAVHSLKDYPTAIPPGLALACVPERAAVSDALVLPRETLERLGADVSASRAVQALASEGGSIGTGSPRRANQLRALPGIGEGLKVQAIRGNVGSRLDKLLAGEVAALVMAEAGLSRLSPEECPQLERVALLAFDPEAEMLPAPGQGALGVGRRSDDPFAAQALAAIHDPRAAAEAVAERAFLAAMGGGCFVPIGALGRFDSASGRLDLRGRVAAEDASGKLRVVEGSASLRNIERPEDLGKRLAATLIAQGAGELVERLKG